MQPPAPPPGAPLDPHDVMGYASTTRRAPSPRAQGGSPAQPPAAPAAQVAHLELRTPNGETRVTPLGAAPVTVGRSDTNTLVVKDEWVSRSHMEITPGPDGRYYVQDKGSRNGVFVNAQPVQFAPLAPNDMIQLGQHRLVFVLDAAKNGAGANGGTMLGGGTVLGGTRMGGSSASEGGRPLTADELTGGGLAVHCTLEGRTEVIIGRSPRSDLVLDHIQISRNHARIRWDGRQWCIADLNSTNGTYVDGNRVTETELREGARIQIGPFRYELRQNVLWRQHDQIRVDALLVTQQIAGGRRILQDVSFSILPTEFVCIVGGSGAGKSTLLDAISGVRPASHGEIFYNGTDYYGNLDEFRSLIGYVPQDDIVPSHLSVEQALTFAAKLRLPPDARPEEIKERVDRALDLMELTERRNLDIHRLSGGQRKRVSIGVELLTDPTLFFLDEATSGLDPGLETRMMQLMRKVADTGKTVILVTHATQNVTLCDKVVFMAPGGYVAFFGPPQEALEFFGVKNFADIYVLLGEKGAPEEWARKYHESAYQDRYVDDRITAVVREKDRRGGNALPPPVLHQDQKLQRARAFSQFKTLTQRYVASIVKDRQNLLIMLLQAPIIGLLLSVVYSRNAFATGLRDPNGSSIDPRNLRTPSDAATLLCLMVIVALWFGVSNSAREIVKEASMYRRERLVNLQLGPYLGSKFVVLLGICFIQNLLMLGIIGVIVPYATRRFSQERPTGQPPRPFEFGPYVDVPWLKAFAVMLVVSFTGVAMGLLISTLVNNPDRAGSIVPIVLIPQVVFSGTIIKYLDLPEVGQKLAWIMAGHWGVQAVGRATGVADWERDLLGIGFEFKRTFWTDDLWWPNIAVMLLIALVCVVGTVWALARKDIKRQLERLRSKRTRPPAVQQTGQVRTA